MVKIFNLSPAPPLRIRAVSYCLLAIGEAVFRLERDFPGFLTKGVSPHLAWTQIIGARKFLAQGMTASTRGRSGM